MCSQIFYPATCESIEYFGAFATTMILQRLSIQSFALYAAVWPQFQCQVLTAKFDPYLVGYGGPMGSKMVAIEMLSPHSYSTSVHTIYAYLAPFSQNTQRDRQRQTDNDGNRPPRS